MLTYGPPPREGPRPSTSAEGSSARKPGQEASAVPCHALGRRHTVDVQAERRPPRGSGEARPRAGGSTPTLSGHRSPCPSLGVGQGCPTLVGTAPPGGPVQRSGRALSLLRCRPRPPGSSARTSGSEPACLLCVPGRGHSRSGGQGSPDNVGEGRGAGAQQVRPSPLGSHRPPGVLDGHFIQTLPSQEQLAGKWPREGERLPAAHPAQEQAMAHPARLRARVPGAHTAPTSGRLGAGPVLAPASSSAKAQPRLRPPGHGFGEWNSRWSSVSLPVK